jgi:protein phosphatase
LAYDADVLQHALLSDCGVRRQINEDRCLVNALERLFIVCDGMGGHAGGELASRLACETIERFVTDTRQGQVSTLPYPFDPQLEPEANRLSMAIRVANRRVYDTAAHTPALAGMGSTVVCALVEGRRVHVAHVGDSRAYRFRDGRLRALTRDHSYVNELIDAGDITESEAATHPDRNAVARALGVDPDVVVDVRTDRVQDDDLLLLCTDGLWGLVSERRMTEVLEQAPDARTGEFRMKWAAQELVRLANRAGGNDNISALLVRWA